MSATPPDAAREPTYLNDVWAWYYHDPHDPQWTFDRYTRLGESSTVEEVLAYNDILRSSIPHGMFFVMREHIFPCWDDPSNLGGVTVSLKILMDKMLSCQAHFVRCIKPNMNQVCICIGGFDRPNAAVLLTVLFTPLLSSS